MQPFFSVPPGQAMRLVMTTCPDTAVSALVDPILQERLAGCIQVIPGVVSTYRWQGQIQRDPEHIVLCKTPEDRLEALLNRLLELHPYEIPELAVVAVDGVLPAYGQWLHDVTRPDTGP
ncbi:MAG: divalent-cation tolerance protein CutA [bacterium]|nr:divalent-cation tolerance protein CutA [bacterium]